MIRQYILNLFEKRQKDAIFTQHAKYIQILIKNFTIGTARFKIDLPVHSMIRWLSEFLIHPIMKPRILHVIIQNRTLQLL